MSRADWIAERALQLHCWTFFEGGPTPWDEAMRQATAEYNARYARLTVIQGGRE